MKGYNTDLGLKLTKDNWNQLCNAGSSHLQEKYSRNANTGPILKFGIS